MSAPGWEALFDELVELEEPKRQARLGELAGRDPELARLLAALLAADPGADATLVGPDADTAVDVGPVRPLLERAPLFVAAALAASPTTRPAQPRPGEDGADRIGPYRLLSLLGTGGMGEVFLAERSDGEFRQRVALKRIRAELALPGVHERFLRERQILAGLDHPGIARLLDGGRTATGDPYFVLEHVDGEPITEWCTRRGAGLEQRLRLMCDVATAVETAHRQLVVHRDLKPSNILVTAEGQAKLLDFGIAKLLEPELGSAQLDQPLGGPLTDLDTRPLTPAYAAPEQLLGEPITTATDVFALGLVLYELLTGCQPFGRRGRSVPDLVARAVQGETAERPSQAARTANDDTLRRLARRLAGDLDLIVGKALHREPTRRYPSAAAFGEDLGRFLAGHPVSARPDSVGYRVGKLVRRHRLAFAVGAVGAAALLAAVAGFGLRLAAERDLARREAARAEAARVEAERVTEFLVGLFGEANPVTAPSRDPAASEILARGAERLERELAAEPAARVRLEQAIGRAYLGLMRPEEALRHIAAVERLRESHGLGTTNEVVTTLGLRVIGELHLGQLNAAEATTKRAIALLEANPDSDPRHMASAVSNLASTLMNAGELEAAEAQFRRAILLLVGRVAADDGELLYARIRVAQLRSLGGDLAAAQAELEDILALVAGRQERQTLWLDALGTLGAVHRMAGDLDSAERRFREGLEVAERMDGPTSPRLGVPLLGLAFLASKRGDIPAAIAHYERALAVAEARQLADDASSAREGLAAMLRQSGRLAEAEVLLRQQLALRSAVQGEQSSDVAWLHYEIAMLEGQQGKFAAAKERFFTALAGFEASVGPQHHWTSWPLHELGLLALERGSAEAAIPLLARALALRERGLAPIRSEIGQTRDALARARAQVAAPSGRSPAG